MITQPLTIADCQRVSMCLAESVSWAQKASEAAKETGLAIQLTVVTFRLSELGNAVASHLKQLQEEQN